MVSDGGDRDGDVDRRVFLVACAVAASVVPGMAHAESARAAGSVEDLRGEAFAEAHAVRRALAQAAPLYVGDNVGTGAQSRLTVQLGRDTRLRLGEQTRITIDRFLVNAGGEITLRSGPVLFDRPAGAQPAPMQIRSPFGLIAVRGTRFFAGPSRGVFGVFVERGSVAVSAAGRRVVLAVGEGTDIARPGAAPTPPAKWGQPRIDAALASVF